MTISEIKKLVEETKDLSMDEMLKISNSLPFFDGVNYMIIIMLGQKFWLIITILNLVLCVLNLIIFILSGLILNLIVGLTCLIAVIAGIINIKREFPELYNKIMNKLKNFKVEFEVKK